MSAPFPWEEVCAIGLGVLRLAPAAFWAATPREIAFAVNARTGAGLGAHPPRRGELEKLMKRFPDLEPSHGR